MKRMQRGMTMLGFLITLSVVILFAYCGMKIVPMYIEYYTVKKTLASIAEQKDAVSKAEIRESFKRHLQIDYVATIKPEMLKIEGGDGGYNLVVDYERREPLIANLDVVGKFRAEQALAAGAGAQ
ncbi:MAG: DUF4845 domain-containing protein [Thermomonas sp.]|uniref:DUF4845 domain-containing protein n=1 Tax=Thermomonas sp. TaxID=1971895 RepID=UPI0039E5A55D